MNRKVIEATREPLLDRIRQAKDEIGLAAPFISREVAAEICLAASTSGAPRRRLITALNDRSVRGGYLSPEGLGLLARSGFEIRSARNLHAKVLLVDRRGGLLGSGNLTTQGLGGQRRKNLELGVDLTPGQAKEADRVFRRWWRRSETVDRATLERYASMARSTGSGRGGGGFGSFVFDDEDLPPDRPAAATGFWLKMLYHHTRRDQPGWWRTVEWVSDGRPPPSPANLVGGPRYRQGDLLLFYLVELGGPIRCCPSVAVVENEARHNPEFVRENAFPGDEKQWPWVTPVKVLDSTSLEAAPKLVEVGIDPGKTERRGRLVLQPEQYEAARRIIGANS